MQAHLDILLIEDNPADAALIREVFAPSGHVRIAWASCLSEGLHAATDQSFDAVLLDLSLPDSAGLETISIACAALPAAPLIVMTGLADEEVALEAVRQGAQDYLVKGQADRRAILRAIHYAIDRKASEEILRQSRDELDRKVRERTADLARAIDVLQAEVRQRQLAERELQQANQVLRMVSECDEAMVRAADEQSLVRDVCRIILDIGGYRMAWVGYAEDDPAKSIRPVGSVGFEAGYLEHAHITWADTPRGRGPTGSAVRTGRPQVGRDFLTDPELAPWREQALQRGFRSSVALPLASDGRVFGALTIYHEQPGAFGEKQVKVLSDLAADLAYGISAHRTREALQDRSQQLRELASELTLAEQRERRRLAEVLHDHLQQLLVGALFQLARLEKVKDPAVRQAATGLHDLIDQSIECSRSLTGELSPPILHEGGLVPALEWLALWMEQKHGMAVVLQADEQAEPDTEDTKVLLFQAIRELLFNAVKHAQVKTVHVEVKQIDGQVRARVADEGVGFDPQAVRGRTGRTGGFGLFSIRERLDLLGGQMEVDSSPGHGSRFTLRAPVRRIVPGEPAGQADELPRPRISKVADSPPPTGTCDAGRRIRVLLADDHLVVRQGLARLLKGEPDIEVVGEASDGVVAVELARRLLPDVVTMDISMPRMDGIEATRILHAELPGVSVIGLSMFEEAERAVAMRQAGAVNYLAKNGPADALIEAIRSCARPVGEQAGLG
jgi:signal transduction histidine kinase